MYVFRHDGKSYGVILPPKCATRSYEHALKRMGAKAYGGRHKFPPAHYEACDVVVASIRHPCDVLVSWYHYDRAGQRFPRTFGEYIGYVMGGGNSYIVKTTLPGAECASVYLRYEDGPHRAWNQFLASCGIEPAETFEHKGKSDDRAPWQSYYSPDLLGAVREKYRRDFERYGYSADFVDKAA